ncbi:membrane protein [Arenimonas maotaiensis]|uniref:Membrane protein n=1 Tax=Arenimonas maotaiensis TaxID=1446479 RepID=A0A917CGW9_9GAMM|nr:ABC transporter permease [Arenimonas maotaiensis]GGF88118.1 membrane protein [Arenimonas maotaiensis]
MSTFTQVREIVLMNLRSIPQRLGASLVIVIGIAGVVGVLVAMLSMSTGLNKTLTATGDPDRAIVLRGGANGELASFLERASVTQIKQDPAIARGADGLPVASAELIVITEVPRKGERSGANVSLRGVEPAGFTLRPELKLLEGRRFTPGLRELMVGKGAYTQFDGLQVGSRLKFRGSYWQVVGVFETGDAHDSELWADLETVQSAFGRSGASSVVARLAYRDALGALKRRLESDPQLNVEVKTEQEFFSAQSSGLTRQIGFLTNIVAVIMAFGALFGALNTMYSAVSARTAEIGTLRALGFGNAPVVASVMAEAMALSLLGGVIGAVTAYLLFNDYSVSTLSGSFTQVAFNFAVTPGLVLQGLIWALGIGFLGGLAPALRAARLPVTAALRGG